MAFIKTIAMMRRKPGTSHEEFRKYYEERHVPLAMNLLGKYLLDYRRNYNSGEYVVEDYSKFGQAATDQNANGLLGEFDAVSEYWYDAATMPEVMQAVGEHRAEIVADEEMFMDRSSLRIFTVEEAITDMSRWR